MATYHRLLHDANRISEQMKPRPRAPESLRFPSRRMVGACYWCGEDRAPQKITRDHLIPRWLVHAMSSPVRHKLNLYHRYVPSCSTCNGRKGPMPPAIFAKLPKYGGALLAPNSPAKVTRGSREWQRETREWQSIVNYVRLTHWGNLPDELADYLIEIVQQDIVVHSAQVYGPPEPPKGGEIEPRAERGKVKVRMMTEPPTATLGDVWPSVGTANADVADAFNSIAHRRV